MAPTAFWTDLHEDDSIYRSRPPRIAKVRAIEATARLLRPTAASLARAAAKKGKGRLGDDNDKENASPNGNGAPRKSTRKRRLTIPQSPKFQPHPKKRALPREQQLTRTSRELREIEAIRKKVQETRRRNQKYHEATTRSVLTYIPKAGGAVAAPKTTSATADAQAFKMTLQSSGGVGIPAVRRQRLTMPVAFNFESDKRAEARKHDKNDTDDDE